jgi:alpha-tubulin suppressor-like RCC1 family protein
MGIQRVCTSGCRVQPYIGVVKGVGSAERAGVLCGGVAENNELWGWGWNGFGELGLGEVKVKLQVRAELATCRAKNKSSREKAR